MNPKIFKAYDIRGIYPGELNEESAYRIGAAFAIFIKKASGKENPQIAVGRDGRKSSTSLFEELKRGLTGQGADVVDIGLSATPTLYFAVSYYGTDGGINITASHNSKEYNGFKMVREKAIPLSKERGIEEIKEMVLSGAFVKSEKEGKVIEKDIKGEYVAANSVPDKFDFKVVVDTANSASGILVPQMLKNLNLVHLFSEIDGNFPNHEPDPNKAENIKTLKEKVIEEKADLGIGLDGDGDRMVFVDEKGEVVPSDFILCLVSESVLRDNPGTKVLYDIRSSNIVKETVEKMGGEAVVSKIGHSYIKEAMREKGIGLGGEYTGHYYSENDGDYFETPYLFLFSVLREMKRTGKPLSELIEPFRVYFHSSEIAFKTENSGEIIERVKEKYGDGKITTIDGLRVDFEDWWFLLRASNTEPILKLVVEAKTEGLMKEKAEEISKLVY
ncbi:MAG: phosphomannomutase/phosphoglucomutase [Candidatus Pacebacteria bacterium]|nr:phosphomannomutase/phosphoglucomutase [Candidatus Paceibacterota bacterium]